MSFPSKATIEAALASLIAVANEAPTRPGSKTLVREVKRVGSLVADFERSTYAALDLGDDLGE
jgi:hypothetical protein